MTNGLIVLVGFCVAILIVLVCREIACWYWKINEALGLLERIARNTDPRPAVAPAPPVEKIAS